MKCFRCGTQTPQHGWVRLRLSNPHLSPVFETCFDTILLCPECKRDLADFLGDP